MLFILDNGHGNNTPGKRSPIWADGSQLFEGDFNRKVVRGIKARLDLLGISSVILVPEDRDISISERVKRANNIYKDNKDCLLISIHGNAGEGTGGEAWTSTGVTKSDYYVKFFYESARQYLRGWRLRGDTRDGDIDWEGNFDILTKTHCPAVLTENLFMDNEKDCKFLLSPEGVEAITALHVDAIITINDELNKV